jgi:hypothetical protein
MNLLNKLKSNGTRWLIKKLVKLISNKYYKFKWRNAPVYINPTSVDFSEIQDGLRRLNIPLEFYSTSALKFESFKKIKLFPADYHGGLKGGVWDEKLLEHYLSFEFLDLINYSKSDIYVDVAACSSPWAKILREKFDLNAFAIDLANDGKLYQNLYYYMIQNATNTSFEDNSIQGLSLHCAFEMFMADDDIKFIQEVYRILKVGGKLVILPLYMHTHYCSYVSPESFSKGYSDEGAKEYIQPNMTGIISSRKYDPINLKSRILDKITELGMTYRVIILKNKDSFGLGVYCHFILEVTR